MHLVPHGLNVNITRTLRMLPFHSTSHYPLTMIVLYPL